MIRSWVPKANALAITLTVVLAVGYVATSSRIAVAGPETAVCANVIDDRMPCGSGSTYRQIYTTGGSCHNSSTWFDPGPWGGASSPVPHHSCCFYERAVYSCVSNSDGTGHYSGAAEYFREILNYGSDCSTATYNYWGGGYHGYCVQVESAQ